MKTMTMLTKAVITKTTKHKPITADDKKDNDYKDNFDNNNWQ